MSDEPASSTENTLEELCLRTVELIDATSGPLKSVRLQRGDTSIEVEWPDLARVTPPALDATAVPVPVADVAPVPVAGAAPPQTPDAARPGDSFVVEAPLVGTFYRAPSPGSRPFVEVGDIVEEGQQVAIVEAMKLMNAVSAERSGRVVEVLVNDAVPVEYGEPLLVLASA
ncbi:acetyl-CoA carboxylase biotin carboxyl carrier protein [Actinomadura alba]|uniref:Biotin carboxyl carrier protein of acetyl-CoA carboxylase n=1 Tax=Actinomadura alba TaxID=406431 RepID=A0ABR7LVA2_9ACTN|nr:acetyl-CoA carboxylase biotin carboxyl carrier protein [Actinomadura alba]MBC6468385.1 acetyl-CoA carboxylase biotin carboxyl carrier protein [Actinomadura alba]